MINDLELITIYGSLDLASNFKAQINYSVSEIQDISKKNSNYSKQFKIAGTKNNHIILKSIFEINNDCEFNPNKKLDAQLLSYTLPILNGYLQLKKINHTLSKEIIDYEMVMYGGNGSLISSLNGLYLSDLDFSDYDHQYNHTSITSSWYNDWLDGYVYPFIDWGAGYTMNTINQQNNYSIDYKDYVPALWLKNIWNKLFAKAGYTYNSDSDFFNSDRFERLILQGSPKLLQTSLENYFKNQLYFKAGEYVNNIDFFPGTVQATLPFPLPTVEGNGNWSGNTFTATEFGDYKFHYTIYSPQAIFNNYTLRINLNGFLVWNSTLVNSGVANFEEHFHTKWISLAPGDVLTFEIFVINNNGSNATITFVPGTSVELEAMYGQKYKLNECFNKISLTEILTSIIKIFDLLVEQDPLNSSNYILKTNDEYYSTGRILDWTNKLDNSTELEEELLPELQNKNILFTYQDDGDFYNSDYKNATNGKIYGQELITLDNDFLKDDSQTLIQPSFAATPLVSLQGSNKIIIPKIYSVNSDGEFEKFNNKNRLLYYGGAIPCEPYYILISANTASSSSNIYFYVEEYGYAGHLDNPINPTFDFNFGLPEQTYINQINSVSATTGSTGYIYPSANLYTEYWENKILETTSKDARLITAKFYLKPSDISNLRFNDSIFVIDTYYKLNKVVYNPLEDETSTVELIKSINNVPEKRYKKKGAIKVVDDVVSARINVGTHNQVLHPHNIVVGRNNIVHDDSVSNLVSGNNNEIAGSKDSQISGLLNKMQANQSLLIGGSGNTMSVVSNAAIIQANDSKISGYTNSASVIISGRENLILKSQYSNILGGSNNQITDSLHSSILNSTESKIKKNAVRNIIAGGYGNYSNGRLNFTLNSSYASNKGVRNFIANSVYSSANGSASNIIGSTYSYVTSAFATIIGGRYNRIDSDYSFSIGGSYNTIESAVPNSILIGVNNHYAVYPNTTVTQGKQVLDLRGTGDRIVYTDFDGVLKFGMALSAVSGTTLIISGGTGTSGITSGITSVLNTGSTHGVYLRTVNNVVYLKSLSAVSPNIIITSSQTENAIALSNNVYINNLTATTNIYSGTTPYNLNVLYSHTGHTHPLSDILNGNLGDTIRHSGGTRGWTANNFLYNPGNKIGINATNISSMLGMRATGASINEMLLQIRNTGSTTTAQSTYELLRLNANGLLTVGQSVANWAGVPTQPDQLQYQTFSTLYTTAHTVSTLLVSEERALGTTGTPNVVMMVNGQAGNEGVNNTALWVRANLIGDNIYNNNVLVLEDTNYIGQNANFYSAILKVIGGASGVVRTGMTISRNLMTSFGSPFVDSGSEVFIQSINRGHQANWNILRMSDSGSSEVFRVRADGNVTVRNLTATTAQNLIVSNAAGTLSTLTLTGTGANNIIVSNATGALSNLTLTGTGTNNVVVTNAAGNLSVRTLTGSGINNLVTATSTGVLGTIPFTGATSAFTIVNSTTTINNYNVTGATSFTALTVGDLFVTGNTTLSNLTASTFYSGATPLQNVFASTGHTHALSQITNTGHTHNVTEIYSGTTSLDTLLNSKRYTLKFDHQSLASPTDGITYYAGNLVEAISTNQGARVIPMLYASTITDIVFANYVTAGGTETFTWSINVLNYSGGVISNTALGSHTYPSNSTLQINRYTGLTISLGATDGIEIKMVVGSVGTNPTNLRVSGLIGLRQN